MSAVKPEAANKRRHRLRARWMIALGLFALLLKSADTGLTGIGIGLLLAAVPVPLYVALALWLDRFEPEPPRLLGWTFFWGASVASFAALLINSVGIDTAHTYVGEAGAELFGNVISAPIVEETAKGLMVYLVYRLRRDEFDNVVDGIIYASMVALGFAMAENAGYYGDALREGGVEQMNVTFFVRGVMSPFAHPLFTSMTGIGLGLARQTTNPHVRRFAPLAGFFLAMLLHALWNGVDGNDFVIAYFFVMLPIFLGVLVLVARSLRRESDLIHRCLEAEVEGGYLAANERLELHTIAERRRSLWRALRQEGVRGWRRQRRRQCAASELAFYRDRVARGLIEPDEKVEKALREQISSRNEGPTPA